jgi:hypothetical protein
VEAGLSPIPHSRLSAVDRLAAAFLLAVLIAGSLCLWIGVPAGVLWLLGQLIESSTTHFVIGLIAVPTAMVLFAPALFWVNRLYLRVAGSYADPDEEEGQTPRRYVRGPLEPLLVGSLVIAIVSLFVWFFVFATNPLAYL